MDQLIIPKLIFFFILITYLVDILLILKGEILSWLLMGVKGLRAQPNTGLEIIILRTVYFVKEYKFRVIPEDDGISVSLRLIWILNQQLIITIPFSAIEKFKHLNIGELKIDMKF